MSTRKTNLFQPRILIYQDDDCSMITDYLICSGFNVISSNKKDIVSKIKNGGYDLCILDHYWRSGEAGDILLLKILRRTDKFTPVIIISDISNYQSIINAYDEGANDYITRPYNFEILVRKINAILKRYNTKMRIVQTNYRLGNFIFDTLNNILTINNTEIKLYDKEAQLLALLCSHEGEILQKDIIMQKLWHGEDNYWNRRSLDVVICHLRSHLQADKKVMIITKRNLGYSLVIQKG